MPEEAKVAIVTGSTSGIGEAVIRRFAADGMRVVVNSRSSVDVGEALAAELGEAIYVQGDVGDPEDVRRIVAATLDAFGRIDVLVNNAGVTRFIDHDDIDAVTPEVWHEILNVNVVGTWGMIQAALPSLRESGGSVITVTSAAGTRPVGSSIPYSVSKAALNHMTTLLAKALGPDVRVNAVAPGFIETPWTEDWSDTLANVRAAAPMKRVGQPEDVVTACTYLLENSYTTGQVIVVDGGLTLVV